MGFRLGPVCSLRSGVGKSLDALHLYLVIRRRGVMMLIIQHGRQHVSPSEISTELLLSVRHCSGLWRKFGEQDGQSVYYNGAHNLVREIGIEEVSVLKKYVQSYLVIMCT